MLQWRGKGLERCTRRSCRRISAARWNTGWRCSGGKWKSRVICVLAEKERLRYSELRRELTDVTDAALAATLKALIADGILWRQQFDEIPPRVEYFLTEKGASVVPILRSICQWAGIYRTEDPAHALPQCKKCNYRGEAPGGTGWAGA